MTDRARIIDLKDFQRLLRYNFRNRNLLDQALTHRSYAFEHPRERTIDNERLEFLGDAVLGLAISDYIYRQLPDCQEGEMTRIRSMLVGRTTLENLARRLAVGGLLLLGKGEAAGGGADQPSNIVGVYEAIIGAIYLDGGFKKANNFIEFHFKEEIKKVFEGGAKKDYKSILQEYTLKEYKAPPRYAVIFEEGPDHRKHFEVAVSFGGMIRGKGEGKNKKSAQQDAAYEALLNTGLLDKS
ncbi:MAG: ribonuclease III [Candidatus Omnitrophota bacterium]|nr:ribonuclease III [Candidatus Omnitrophota bacterium]